MTRLLPARAPRGRRGRGLAAGGNIAAGPPAPPAVPTQAGQRCPSVSGLQQHPQPGQTPQPPSLGVPSRAVPKRERRRQLLFPTSDALQRAGLCAGHPSRKQQCPAEPPAQPVRSRSRMRPGGIREQCPARGCRHGWAGLGRSAALGVHLGFREGFGAKLWLLILKCLTTDSSDSTDGVGSGTRELGGCWSPWGGGIWGLGGHRDVSQAVSFSVSPRRAVASSSGGTCAGASRVFTGPAERPAVPGQVGAVPGPGVPVVPCGTRVQQWGRGWGALGTPNTCPGVGGATWMP